jgi:hypothetical protein
LPSSEKKKSAGRLTLTPAEPTPGDWQMPTRERRVRAAGLAAAADRVAPARLFAEQAKSATRKSSPSAGQGLGGAAELEDYDVTNQYTALGSLKPGLFRRWLLTVLLVLVDWACRHFFTRGHLARVQSIHFARWVFIDDKTRVVFVSNYDGGHQAYMDDFINTVAWGLNLLFSNGIGCRTRWLILDGARIEQRFKYFQRRHQLPTQVWYKAYPGLALVDLKRNASIREGLERETMSDAEALAWLRLL